MNQHQDSQETEFHELVKAARSGDPDAIAQLIDGYWNYLVFIANRELEPIIKTKLGASDVVQESMLHAQQHFGKFRGGSEAEFKNWLNAILVNDIRKARRHYATKKRSSNREIKLQERSDVVGVIRDQNLTPSSEAIDRETAEALSQALAKLSEPDQQVIELRNVQRLSFVEIGRKIGLSEDATRKRWARAIEYLKRNLNNHNQDSK